MEGQWRHYGQHGLTLVGHVEGTPLAKMLQIRCIHGDVRDYLTVMAHIQVAGQHFRCGVLVVMHLDSPVLLGRDCPILN